jgi:hypothetical protein
MELARAQAAIVAENLVDLPGAASRGGRDSRSRDGGMVFLPGGHRPDEA